MHFLQGNSWKITGSQKVQQKKDPLDCNSAKKLVFFKIKVATFFFTEPIQLILRISG
jgi:hypothetical protein